MLLILSLTACIHGADRQVEKYSWRDFESPDVLKKFDGLTRKEEQEIFVTVLQQEIFTDENPWGLSEACINEIIECNQAVTALDIDCMLRDHGVKTDAYILEEEKNSAGNNPLHIVAQHGTLAHALVAKDRHPNDLLLWKNKAGKTPIDLAKECNKRDVCDVLTEALKEHQDAEEAEYEREKAEWEQYQQGSSDDYSDDALEYEPFPWKRRY